MTIKTLPKFQGRPLIEVPETMPVANFLVGDFGKAVLEEYNGRVKADYNNNDNLKVLSYNEDDGIVKGSNPFAVVLVNQIVEQEGLRTASQADLERILKVKALPLIGQYEDSSLVLRLDSNPNSYLAKHLNEQLKERDKKLKLPIMIPLNGLKLEADSDSSYGLAFKLKEDAEIFYAPILNQCGYFNSEDVDKKTGLTTKTRRYEGERYNYTAERGLRGLCLSRVFGTDSYGDGLAASDEEGRVVLVRGEATSQNLKQNILTEINNEYSQQHEKLIAKRDKALSKALEIMKE